MAKLTLEITVGGKSISSVYDVSDRGAADVLNAVWLSEHPDNLPTTTPQGKLDWIVQTFIPSILKQHTADAEEAHIEMQRRELKEQDDMLSVELARVRRNSRRNLIDFK